MADEVNTTIHEINFSDADYEQAARNYRPELLYIPMLAAQETLKYMSPIPNARYKEVLSSVIGEAQMAPYKADRRQGDQTDVEQRELEVFLGNVAFDFEPNRYIQTLIGRAAAFMGDAQAQAPSAKMVLACAMAAIGEHLNEAIFTAKRNAAGDTTNDLFNGFNTIASTEIDAGNISTPKGNLLELTGDIDETNAVEVAKMIERKAHAVLRRKDKILFCDPAFADAYNDGYLLTHTAVPYNTQYNQMYVEGSGHKTTIVPLEALVGTKMYYLTTRDNMVYGFNNMSDQARMEVRRYQPWMLTMAGAMFFGTQFRSLNPRMIQVVKLHETPAGGDQQGGENESGQIPQNP